MPEIYTQDISACMAGTIGDGGLTDEELAPALDDAWKAWGGIRKDLAGDGFPAVAAASRIPDPDEIRAAADRLSAACDTVAVIGIGGSSLGAEALYALARRPRTALRFLGNPDPETLARFRASVDLARTGVVIVSKSGATAETLAIAMTLMPSLAAARAGVPASDFGAVIAGPGDNPLRRLADHWGLGVIDHPEDIGGRYSALSAVGMLPAAVAGLDMEAVRAGAAEALSANMTGADAREVPAALGAAVSLALQRARDVRMTVMMPYADALLPFARWYRQLWAESTGKDGHGTTPIDALGAVDQHSQLQLYLDGPADKMFTVLAPSPRGRGDRVAPDLAVLADSGYLAGQATGDLLAAEQEATIESLVASGRPVRRIALPRVDEAAVGALMVHFMLETVAAARMLGVDPFDQPAVDGGKERVREHLGRGRVTVST